MQANSFFLRRAVARPAAWQLRYPALALASATDLMEEPRKQIVVAAADQDCIRMVFFSSLGSVLDLHTTWDDLARGAALARFHASLESMVVAGFVHARDADPIYS